MEKLHVIPEHHTMLGPTHQLEEDLMITVKYFRKLLGVDHFPPDLGATHDLLQAINDKMVVMKGDEVKDKTLAITEIRELMIQIDLIVQPVIDCLTTINKTLAISARREIDSHLYRLHKEVNKQIRQVNKVID